MTDPVEPEPRSPTGRRVLTSVELAGHLDHRLYGDELGDDDVRDGCALASRIGCAAVLVRPEHVRLAAEQVAGGSVGVATALGWYRPDTDRFTTADMLAEAATLMDAGASELAIVATKPRLLPAGGHELADQVAALVEALTPHAARVRVVLDTANLSVEEMRTTCRHSAQAGAWMVQGGSWRGQRTGLSQMSLLRAALEPSVLLKWTEPVKSVDSLLLCIGLGVDRFNADSEKLVADAARAERDGPLTVPVAGVDY